MYFEPHPLAISRGFGARLVDVDGNVKVQQRRIAGVVWCPDRLVESCERVEALQARHGARLILTQELDLECSSRRAKTADRRRRQGVTNGESRLMSRSDVIDEVAKWQCKIQ